MLVMVTGGRDYADYDCVASTFDALSADPDCDYIVVIQGGARGADRLAKRWCDLHRIPCRTFPADWDAHGKAAGAIRNIEMLEFGPPDLVVAFPGGRGTAHAMREAKARGIPLQVMTDGDR